MDNSVTCRELLASAIRKTSGPNCELVDKIVEALRGCGYTIVPIVPTKEMIDSAWEDALAEDAAGVWSTMIRVFGASVTAE
jgi:hypothetical protein